MSNEALVLMAAALVGISGLPGLLLGSPACGAASARRCARWHTASVGVMTLGAALGLVAAGRALAGIGGGPLRWSWGLPGAEFLVALDALSACFVVPILLIGCVNAWYARAYWPLGSGAPHAGRVLCFYGLALAGMVLVTLARNGVLFLAAWEVMAVSAFFLVTAEEDKPDVRAAGWIYFVATHTSTLLLFGLFGLIWTARGSFLLEPLAPGSLPPGLADAIFLTALAGFGIKAGLWPGHVWLPPAHASAPSHVSAMMSGVLIKMGVYGVVRVTALFAAPPLWWGELLLGLGVVSGVLGVAFAIGQHDLKRLLAYHSIENIGIIFMGLGLAVSGRALGDWRWIALGLGAALLHTWNHGLFKSLLFLGAGAVQHATHTRELDALGGLAKPMPGTALLFLIGAAAICGLPPLNGFVSELLLYLGMFGGLADSAGAAAAEPGRWLQAAVGIPALALIGGLALACFVKVHATVFLGEPRSSHARGVRESPPAMLVPMGILAAVCVAIGLAPGLAAPWLDAAVGAWVGGAAGPRLAALAPLTQVTGIGGALWLGLAAGGLMLGLFRARRPALGVPGGHDAAPLGGTGAIPAAAPASGPWAAAVEPVGPGSMGAAWVGAGSGGAGSVGAASVGTWDCGYIQPTARMQYTGSSFGQLLVHLWRRVLLPVTGPPRERAPRARGLFPAPAAFDSHVPDTVLDRLILPALHGITWAAGWLRVLQRGRVQDYLLYVFLTLIVLLLLK